MPNPQGKGLGTLVWSQEAAHLVQHAHVEDKLVVQQRAQVCLIAHDAQADLAHAKVGTHRISGTCLEAVQLGHCRHQVQGSVPGKEARAHSTARICSEHWPGLALQGSSSAA